MIESQQTQWRQLQSTARQMLGNPRLLPKNLANKHFDPTLHLWISPTFTPEKHWVFYQPKPHVNPLPKPIVQQIIWQQDADFNRWRNSPEDFQIEPTFETKTTEVEWEYCRKMRAKLSNINVPPFIDVESNGRDGDIYGVETLDYFYSTRITWWSEHPNEWQELAEWYQQVRIVLAERFND